MKSLTATVKGLVTGMVMILVSIVIYSIKGNFENKLQYITYCLYVAGIVWTLVGYSRLNDHPDKFGAYFSQGFKCFIVVTLLMVIFTITFLLMHPELKEEMAVIYKADLVKKGDSTLHEIEDKMKMAKKSFMPSLIMGAIFGYLVIGALVTVITSAIFSRRVQRAV